LEIQSLLSHWKNRRPRDILSGEKEKKGFSSIRLCCGLRNHGESGFSGSVGGRKFFSAGYERVSRRQGGRRRSSSSKKKKGVIEKIDKDAAGVVAIPK